MERDITFAFDDHQLLEIQESFMPLLHPEGVLPHIEGNNLMVKIFGATEEELDALEAKVVFEICGILEDVYLSFF